MELLVALSFALGLGGPLGAWAYARRQRQRARIGPDGVQEANILVRQRYRPQTITARCGVPLRLSFLRDEDNPCSRRVIFPDFGISRSLPSFRTTTICLTPQREGDFLFTCEMGMYEGTLVVIGGRRRPKEAEAATAGSGGQGSGGRSES